VAAAAGSATCSLDSRIPALPTRLLFQEPQQEDLLLLDTTPWDLEQGATLSLKQRRARIEEIRSRLATVSHHNDPVVLAAYSSWLTELGTHLSFLGDWTEAEQLFRRALSLEEQLDRPSTVASLYSNLAMVARRFGKLATAEDLLRKALELGADSDASASYLANLGLVLASEGKVDEAEPLLLKAAEVYEERDDRIRLGHVFNNLADLCYRKRDLPRAEEMSRRALQLYEEIGYLPGRSASLSNLGTALLLHGDQEGAEKAFQEAMSIDEALGRRDRLPDHLGRLAYVDLISGEFAAAETRSREALSLASEMGAWEGMAAAWITLGTIGAARGDLSAARENWTEARNLFVQMGDLRRAEEVERRLRDLLGSGAQQQPIDVDPTGSRS
jgi:tetratricopeptide (TPR) repeat protein